MIADSSYDVGELIARPRAGLVAGLGGAAVMLVAFGGLQPAGAAMVWLGDVGRAMLPARWESAVALPAAGLACHLGAGAIFGALYAACQQRAPVSGLAVVGGFYGFMLWLGSDLVLVRWLRVGPALIETWMGLLSVMAYGLTLAAWATWRQRVSAGLGAASQPLD